ncbi:class I SAM-dependent methyltransferase [Herbiconiux liukaitaii]|uniref:class I SAM-dependent methyltransferase n=1 Tax=Herbiconiux liukaitaii TaxID=3342799 RepID=UPI0035BB68FA
MDGEHYFSARPAGELELREIDVTLAGSPYRVATSSKIFSPDHIDTGTQVLLANVPTPPETGDLLDLGCGWGPIALTLALESPRATVWAVDVNERALDLVRRNFHMMGLENINACRPGDVPEEVRFAAIWSNPPIRVGKEVLHGMLRHWIPRLHPDSEAWLVVQKHLGSDSLQRWLEAEFPAFAVSRAVSVKTFRMLRVVSA